MSSSDKEVKSYLRDLERHLSNLPRRRRKEILEEIRNHIQESRQELGADHPIEDVLDRLGEPEEIALEAQNAFDSPQRKSRLLEVIALALLLPGSVLIPLIGWLIGVVLLWMSPVWTTRDKLIGTLIVPGGLLPAFFVGMLATCSVTTTSTGQQFSDCPTGWISVLRGIGFWGLLVIGPIAATIYLAIRLRHAPIGSDPPLTNGHFSRGGGAAIGGILLVIFLLVGMVWIYFAYLPS